MTSHGIQRAPSPSTPTSATRAATAGGGRAAPPVPAPGAKSILALRPVSALTPVSMYCVPVASM